MAFNKRGIEWTDEKVERLKTLLINGVSTREISDILTSEFGREATVQSVQQAQHRHKLTRHLAEIPDDGITYYTDESIPDDNYMIFSDCHAPYYDEIYLNRLLAIADKLGITKAISAGDTLDMDFAKYFYDPEKSDLDTEIAKSTPLFQALDYFDEVTFLQGNHENRIGRMTDGKVQARHIFKIFGEKVWNEKFRYIENKTRLNIGEKWLVTHPTNYSQLSASVAVRLAEKYHRHVINAHGHFIAFRYDRSGKHECYDSGGLFNVDKIEYLANSTTTHPSWNQGFLMLLDGYAHQFHDGTKWSHWLGR